jgi:hypothetical protein
MLKLDSIAIPTRRISPANQTLEGPGRNGPHGDVVLGLSVWSWISPDQSVLARSFSEEGHGWFRTGDSSLVNRLLSMADSATLVPMDGGCELTRMSGWPPSRLVGRLGGALVAVSVIALLLLPTVANADDGESSSGFCQRRLAVDYAAPLAAMPGARPVPEGELPFGPRNFSVHTVGHLRGRPHVALAGSNYGYAFAAKNNPYRTVDLGWQWEATAWVVDRDGRPLRELGTRGWRVTRVKEMSKLRVAFPATRPGFVRVDVRIATLDGRTLGTYRDYFRVLKPSNDVRLAVEDASVHPGERAVGLVENRGAGNLSNVSGSLEVEHFSGAAWMAVPQPLNPRSILPYGYFLAPGENARCDGYDVPADAEPGRYRFSASAFVGNLKRKVTLTGPFEVAP